LLPCVDSPSEDNSEAALERMAQERDRLSEHIDELVQTRDALDVLMATARAHRDSEARAQSVRARSGPGEGTSAPRVLES
ncbi:hypothetical protein ACWGLF_43630, partial [Streptomyces puniciscabiei]